QALCRGAVKQDNTGSRCQLREVMIEDRAKDCVALLKGRRVTVSDAEPAVAISEEETPLDEAALPRQPVQPFGSQKAGMNKILAKVDAAGPILRSGIRCCLEDDDTEAGAGEADGGAQASTTGANDDHVVLGSSHAISFEPTRRSSDYSLIVAVAQSTAQTAV